MKPIFEHPSPNFGNDEVVMVVVYSVIGLIIMTPLALELEKQQAKSE